MKLSDYICLTIEEVVRGAKRADVTLREDGSGAILSESNLDITGAPHVTKLGTTARHNINKPIINIGFKVLVETEESKDADGNIAANVKIAKASGEIKTSESERISQEVTFSIPVLLSLRTKQNDTASPSSSD